MRASNLQDKLRDSNPWLLGFCSSRLMVHPFYGREVDIHPIIDQINQKCQRRKCRKIKAGYQGSNTSKGEDHNFFPFRSSIQTLIWI